MREWHYAVRSNTRRKIVEAEILRDDDDPAPDDAVDLFFRAILIGGGIEIALAAVVIGILKVFA